MLNKRLLLIWIAFFAFVTVSIAGNTGKLAGRVTDKQTGDPLIGVNILVKGTNFGAATDEDGFYYILQVPPGTYDVEASYIGYHNVTVKDVRIKVDLTQRINVTMESAAIEGPSVEVYAEQPLVQRDITSTRRVASRQEMQDTPGFESTTDIFLLQGGSVVDANPQAITFGDGTQLQVRDERGEKAAKLHGTSFRDLGPLAIPTFRPLGVTSMSFRATRGISRESTTRVMHCAGHQSSIFNSSIEFTPSRLSGRARRR